MQKNVASQTLTVLAVDTATGKKKTGDASNITLYLNGDNGGVTVLSTNSGHPTEDDATNSPGTYTIALTQGETNFDKIVYSGKSSTSNIEIVPTTIYTEQRDWTLIRDFSAVSGVSDRSLLQAARFLRNKFSISGSTLTVTKEDDSTTAWTTALTTDPSAVPIVGSDPA